VCETEDPHKNIPRGIYGSIAIVTVIYVVLSIVAVGSLSQAELVAAEEYALAVAAEPSMGNAGRILVSVAALLATALRWPLSMKCLSPSPFVTVKPSL